MKKKLLAAALALLILVPLGVLAALSVWGEDLFNAQMRPDHVRSEDPDFVDLN